MVYLYYLGQTGLFSLSTKSWECWTINQKCKLVACHYFGRVVGYSEKLIKIGSGFKFNSEVNSYSK